MAVHAHGGEMLLERVPVALLAQASRKTWSNDTNKQKNMGKEQSGHDAKILPFHSIEF